MPLPELTLISVGYTAADGHAELNGLYPEAMLMSVVHVATKGSVRICGSDVMGAMLLSMAHATSLDCEEIHDLCY